VKPVPEPHHFGSAVPEHDADPAPASQNWSKHKKSNFIFYSLVELKCCKNVPKNDLKLG
jgi:hypothetical protein